MNLAASLKTSINDAELAQFEATANEWWDENGPFKPLHRLNPVRLQFIRDQLCSHFGRDRSSLKPLKGLRILDVGCGGGLISEPLARLGADVTAIDAGEEAISVASSHAKQSGLSITFQQTTAETLVEAGDQFDAVVSLEVIEHVADIDQFLGSIGQLVRPGGAVLLGTLNRTLKSLALAKIGAEYILRWVPAGTHNWRQFVKPSELARGLRSHDVMLSALSGVTYNPVRDEWRLTDDIDVNYLAAFQRVGK